MTRLLRYVEYDTNGGCWLWSGAVITNAGYGNLPINGRTCAASRAAWIVYHGKISEGLFVLHKCDNRLCCNPDHLFLGTHQDNMKDMRAKGRGQGARGSRSGNTRLTEAAVREIRAGLAAGRTQQSMADQYSVHPATIQAINDGRSWSWLH